MKNERKNLNGFRFLNAYSVVPGLSTLPASLQGHRPCGTSAYPLTLRPAIDPGLRRVGREILASKTGGSSTQNHRRTMVHLI